MVMDKALWRRFEAMSKVQISVVAIGLGCRRSRPGQ